MKLSTTVKKTIDGVLELFHQQILLYIFCH